MTELERLRWPLCPLDPGLNQRLWYADEPICSNRQHNKRRWIYKQRSIKRRRTKIWLDKAITFDMMFSASRPRKMSQDEIELRRQRIRMVIENKAVAIQNVMVIVP